MVVPIYSILLLCVYLSLSAFFSASETAFTSLTIADINQIRKANKSKGDILQKFYDSPNSFLTTVLICNNLVNVLISVTTTTITMKISASWVLAATTAGTTIILLIFGEIMPKQIAIANNKLIISQVIYIIKALSVLLYPVIVFFNILAKIVSRVFSQTQTTMSTDEIVHMINYAKNIGIIDRYKSHLISSIFQWENLSIKSILTRRQNVIALDGNTLIADAIERFIELDYNEFPIYKDDRENIKGIVSVISCMKAWESGRGHLRLSDISEDAVFVPQSLSISDFLQNHYKSKTIVVLDEYGGLEGYVKKEDIVRLFDLEIISDNSKEWVSVKGKMSLFKFKEYFSLDIDVEDLGVSENVSGYIIMAHGGLPQPHTIIKTKIGEFKVDTIGNNVIIKTWFKKKV